MWPLLKLRAGVLSLVLGICLIITFITSAIILLGYYYRVRHLNITIRSKLIYNVESGVAVVLSKPNITTYNQPIGVDLFGDGEDSVSINRFFWGFWDLYHVSANKSRFTEYKRFLLGFQADTIGGSALYVAEDRRPISIAGDTRIVGNVYLPASGIKTTYINRKGYSRDSLVYGKIKTSKEDLPTLDIQRMEQINTWMKKQYVGIEEGNGDLYAYDSISETHQFKYDISKSKEPVYITEQVLNYEIISSDTLIIIGPEANIDGAILLAPKIIIQAGFKGNLQAFAQDSLVVEDGVALKYPSALYVGCVTYTCHLSIGKSSVAGQVVLYGPKAEMRNKMLTLSQGSLINGLVYCDGLLNFEGKVIGHIATKKFYLRTGSSIFENHLLDVEIRQELGTYFLQSDLWGAGQKSGVLVFINDKP